MFKLILCVALIGAICPLGTALKKRPDMQIQPIVLEPEAAVDELVDPIEGNVESEQPIAELVDPIDGYAKPAKPVQPELSILPATIPPKSCPEPCNYLAKCSPYYKSYIYTIVNGRCRIYQNSCIFGMENCSRANRCLKPMKQVSQKKCRSFCQRLCKPLRKPVCASFPVTNEDGRSDFESISFANRCELDRYACLADHAYVSEPQDGACA